MQDFLSCEKCREHFIQGAGYSTLKDVYYVSKTHWVASQVKDHRSHVDNSYVKQPIYFLLL